MEGSGGWGVTARVCGVPFWGDTRQWLWLHNIVNVPNVPDGTFYALCILSQ